MESDRFLINTYRPMMDEAQRGFEEVYASCNMRIYKRTRFTQLAYVRDVKVIYQHIEN